MKLNHRVITTSPSTPDRTPGPSPGRGMQDLSVMEKHGLRKCQERTGGLGLPLPSSDSGYKWPSLSPQPRRQAEKRGQTRSRGENGKPPTGSGSLLGLLWSPRSPKAQHRGAAPRCPPWGPAVPKAARATAAESCRWDGGSLPGVPPPRARGTGGAGGCSGSPEWRGHPPPLGGPQTPPRPRTAG